MRVHAYPCASPMLSRGAAQRHQSDAQRPDTNSALVALLSGFHIRRRLYTYLEPQ